MSKKAVEHHKKAQEHHGHAARHHGEAAKHHEAGHHEKAAHHAHLARAHAIHARGHSEEATRAHHEEHGDKPKLQRIDSRISKGCWSPRLRARAPLDGLKLAGTPNVKSAVPACVEKV